jgi:hypothetical protein
MTDNAVWWSRFLCSVLGHKWRAGGPGAAVCVRLACRGSVERRAGVMIVRRRNPWIIAWFVIVVIETALSTIGIRQFEGPAWMLVVVIAFCAGRWDGRVNRHD